MDLPATPPSPKKDLPRPFKKGDAAVHGSDVIGLSGGGGADAPGQAVTLDNSSARIGPKYKRVLADELAKVGRRNYKKIASGGSLGGKR